MDAFHVVGQVMGATDGHFGLVVFDHLPLGHLQYNAARLMHNPGRCVIVNTQP